MKLSLVLDPETYRTLKFLAKIKKIPMAKAAELAIEEQLDKPLFS